MSLHQSGKASGMTGESWHEDERIEAFDDHRGEPGTGRHRRGVVGVADFAPGTYPACSVHGALLAIGGGAWRCLVEGCNVGGRTAWPWAA